MRGARRQARHAAQEHLTLDEFHERVWWSTAEEELLDRITRYARLMGWMVYHTWNSEHSEEGFP